MEGVPINLLIDTRVEVSAISGKFIWTNFERFNKTSVFPVNNMIVMSGTTKNKEHMNKQMYIY